MTPFVLGCILAVIPSQAPAQTPVAAAVARPADTGALGTRTGHDVSVSVGYYTYAEPGAQRISIHGPRIGGRYTGTTSLGTQRRWFASADLRGSLGNATYDGWCSPFVLTPNSASPNGYEVGLGDASPCSESGDRDWYVDARGLVGRDFVARRWGLSPEGGLGVRHLSNGTTGVAGYRRDDYLYLPLGLTARRSLPSRRAVSAGLEFDVLLRGWQNTYGSKLGGGEVPATATAPAFTIDRFSDVAFAQHSGWGLRAGARYEISRHWSVEPVFIHWSVGASPVNDQTITFTVDNVTAREQLGFYEPVNTTNEVVVSLGFHF